MTQSRSQSRRRRPAVVLAAAALAAAPVLSVVLPAPVARAEVSANTSGQPTQNGAGNPAVTISLSGSTAMSNFTRSPGISLLTPGTSIVLNNGTGGAPTTYTAPIGGAVSFQLASNNFTAPDVPVGGPFPSAANTQVHSALRIEWHEQGSVEGILELANDQIGYAGGAAGTPLVPGSTRNPTSTNRVWVNTQQITAVPYTNNGLPLSTSTYNTYSSYNAAGRNLQGGQNRVQMAISDVNHRQGFAIGGANGAFNAAPGTPGYGRGNPALAAAAGNVSGVGQAGARQQLVDAANLNMPTTNIDPQTGASYAPGPWNTAGIDNLVSRQVAVTATVFAANPGTGLQRLNRTDAQWLQATGRLANGADFNVATRDVNSGTRNVAALNVGLDPSFAVGENDSGNGLVNGVAQTAIGPNFRSSNKTSGGSQLRPTVQNGRMSLGHLGLPDTRGAGGTSPVRALGYADSAADGTFVDVSYNSITDGSYALFQNQTYVTVKRPGAAFAGDTPAPWAARTDAETGIKGDNAGNDVADFRANILQTVANYADFGSNVSVANPADQLLATSFLLPELLQRSKTVDGVGTTGPNPNYNAALRNFIGGTSLANNFSPGGAAAPTVSAGANQRYGGALSNPLGDNDINITAANGAAGGTYLFGNFNQNGVRDFASFKTAVAAQAALGTDNSMFTGAPNAAAIANLPAPLAAMQGQRGFNGANANAGAAGASKGDLIALGDFNGDGAFNGEDLRLMARGTTLADNNTTDTLTGNFADRVRSNDVVLRKNAALDYLQTGAGGAAGFTGATAQQRTDARAVVRDNAGAVAADLDPTGANAFNKYDVNRDGRADRRDAKIVDYFVGRRTDNLNDQLGAVLRTDNGAGQAAVGRDFAGQAFASGATPLDPTAPANAAIPRRQISLTDVELNDDRAISHTGAASDTRLIVLNLQGRDVNPSRTGNEVDAINRLLNGDANFDGAVDSSDFSLLASFFGTTDRTWRSGDFNFDGFVDSSDFSFLASNFGKSLLPGSPDVVTAADWANLEAFGATVGVPEPTSAGVLALAALGLLSTRRRH